ncbi:beta-1,4-xylosyltransferase IRX9-like [Humulus lupulus]|uniref:beta-1,4-xylosyltransferase IRX9-like n=1 Tax=Humulus lupulus TaxID=3486 RepID=UPI002B401DD9|nr:beta-1,4-xylosyltransferase IRX9-like [Humulus lupulus]XP_062117210.1 beta-1,4-xylosyltransferase IRX9-like [Humulus lupulus]
MGSVERSKKRVHVWKKAIVHFCLCFVMGFFTGFFPTGKSSLFSYDNFNYVVSSSTSNKQEFSPQPIETTSHRETTIRFTTTTGSTTTNVNVSEEAIVPMPHERPQRMKLSEQEEEEEKRQLPPPRKLVIIVTPTSTNDNKFQGVLLRRLANSLRLAKPPLLWIVVEGQSESNDVSQILRKTGIMYRHLVFKENFTDIEAELDHQRNVALKHIEHHKLSGIVHFASLSNVYDLEFFDELRKIEAFGTWPMALLAANRQKVMIEGPVCDSSQVMGWHLRKMNNETDDDSKPPIQISSFGFNSSILWDPERWGRTSPVQTTSQDSIKFVKQVVLEDETEIKGIPPDGCSKIMLWRLNFPFQSSPNNVVPPLSTAIDNSQR